ncbi:MAG: hypothetical protein K6G50_07515 [bacterium]|nr:hypothetical protein [bacterium]
MNISAANTNLVSNNAPCAKNVPAGNVPAENNSAALDTLELSSEEKDDINTLVSLKGGKLEDYTIVAGTKGDDEINVKNGENGGLDVTVNGKTTSYTAEQSAKMIIASGEGCDRIKVDKEVKQDMLISGGRGDMDNIESGAGNDIIIDNLGQNFIDGGKGDDIIVAKCTDTPVPYNLSVVHGHIIDGNVLTGGAGNDIVVGSEYHDALFGMDGNDIIFGRDGDDVILAGAGQNFVDGGKGGDYIENQGAGAIIIGGEGDDFIDVWQPAKAIIDKSGENTIQAAVSVDYLIASPESKVTISETPKTL